MNAQGNMRINFKVVGDYAHVRLRYQHFGWGSMMIDNDPIDGMTGGDTWTFFYRPEIINPFTPESSIGSRHIQWTGEDSEAALEAQVLASLPPGNNEHDNHRFTTMSSFTFVSQDRMSLSQASPTLSEDSGQDLEDVRVFVETQGSVTWINVEFKRALNNSDPGDKPIKTVTMESSWAFGQDNEFFVEHPPSQDGWAGKLTINFYTGVLVIIGIVDWEMFSPVFGGGFVATVLAFVIVRQCPSRSKFIDKLRFERVGTPSTPTMLDAATCFARQTVQLLNWGELLIILWYIFIVLVFMSYASSVIYER